MVVGEGNQRCGAASRSEAHGGGCESLLTNVWKSPEETEGAWYVLLNLHRLSVTVVNADTDMEV